MRTIAEIIEYLEREQEHHIFCLKNGVLTTAEILEAVNNLRSIQRTIDYILCKTP